MKKFLLLLCVCAIAFVSCKDNVTPPVEVASVTVSPATFSLFADEALPTLTATVEPKDAEDPTVTWSSSDPAIIAVDASTGALSLAVADIPDAEKAVTITAKAGEKTGTSIITVKGQIAKYEVIDISEEVGLRILDRNVGATAAYDGKNDAAAIGNFYQWGKNTAVASGADTKANSNFSDTWNAAGEGFKDWATAANTPCPVGYSIPTYEQMKSITDITSNYDDFFWEEGYISDEDYYAGKALYEKLKLVGTGAFVAGGAKKPLMLSAEFLWTSTLSPGQTGETDGVNDDGFKYAYSYCFNNFPTINKTDIVNMAMPIRCVKEAPKGK
jgi:hypothetical protein